MKELKDPNIIIQRVKKQSDEGRHGGQWKVAYADFVTALMAFFMLLWLISMIAPEKRARVAEYFKHFSIFHEGGTSFMDKSSEIFDEAGESAQKVPRELIGTSNMRPEKFEETIRNAIKEKLGDVKDQILVDIFEGGVRIQLVDKEGKPMFDLGSSQPTSLGLRVLNVIGDNIKYLPNPVTIEGHTDSLPYNSVSYSNWELSTERALSARKELEKNGLSPDRLTRVAGYADTVPLIKEDTRDSRNRRISIILMFPTQEKGLHSSQDYSDYEHIGQ
ncbi:MAG: flagellar motor protein MotB [Nitrospirota bacterium]